MSFIGNRPDSYGYSSTTYEHFSGNSSNTSFSLSRAVSSNSDVQVVVNNVIQDPGVSYYITDLYTLTFYSAPSTGTDNIYVVYRNFINTGIGLGANSVSSEVIRSRAINTSHLGDITEINSGVGNSLTLKSNNISAVTIDDSGDVTISGNLSVEGSTTTINTETLIIEDKNIVLGNVASPTNVTADGAGISVLGDTDKTFNWVSANSSWESSENLNLVSGKSYKIGNTAVLSSTALGSGVISSSLTSLGTLGSLAVSGNSLLSNVEYIGNLTGGTGVVNIGSGQIFKDANGKVGIGTNSPAQKLEIRGNGGGDTVTLQLTNEGSHPARLRLHSGHGNWSVGNSITVGNALEFRDESSSLTRMLINSSGNVGIGISDPTYKLHVRGSATGALTAMQIDNSSSAGIGNQTYLNVFTFDGTQYRGGKIYSSIDGAGWTDARLTLQSQVSGGGYNDTLTLRGSNAGIGTTSPDTKLHVYSTGNANDAHGLIKAEASTAANAVNASFTTKNWSGTSQFMQWENYGLRIGGRILTNYGQGNIYFTTGNDAIRATLYNTGGHFSATGNLHTNRNRLAFSGTATDPNHSIYNNYNNIDSEGSWDGIKMNVYAGLSVRVGNANGATPTTALYVNSSGNVGFGGVSDPVFPIDLNASSSSIAIRLRGRSSDTLSAITFDNSTANAGSSANYIQSGTSNPYIAFGTSNTERFRIDYIGKIIHYFSGAHSYGSTHVINQNAVGNSDGPKIAFKKLQSDTTTTTYAVGILHGVNEKSFAVTTGSDTGFGTTLMTIDNNGRMKVPNQPAFHGYRTTSTAAGIQSGFTAIVNIGSHWVPSTGRFTAPVAGTYLFFFSSIGTGAASSADVYLYRNGSIRQDALSVRPTSLSNGYSSTGASFGMVTLAANDYVEAYSTAGLYSDGNCWIRFGGYLLG